MKRSLIIGLLIFLFAYGVPPLSIMAGDKPITPYGDFCPECSNYGSCQFMLSRERAQKALEDYYGKKGYQVEIVRLRGRFIRARILEKGSVVDEIVFDRKTGRIRSIF